MSKRSESSLKFGTDIPQFAIFFEIVYVHHYDMCREDTVCPRSTPHRSPGRTLLKLTTTYEWRILIVTLVLTNLTVDAKAQKVENEVHEIVVRLFDGMRAGDSELVRSVFHDRALIGRAITLGDMTRLRTGPVDSFVEAVGRPREHAWDERIWDVDINVDGALASAWMEYAFYVGDELHHCGVNSMHLFRTDDGWKIVHLIDTDRGLDCRWSEDEPSSSTD